jgi:hypothetical protein
MIKIVRFSMAAMGRGQNCQFQLVHKLQSKLFISAWLNGSCSKLLAPACLDDLNTPWLKLSVSAWLERIIIKIVSSSMSGICHGQNSLLQHG